MRRPREERWLPGTTEEALGDASESMGRRCFCDRSGPVLFRQAGAMKQVAEAWVGTHGIVDRLHLYEKKAGPLPLGLFQPGEGAFFIAEPRIDYRYESRSNVALFGALFQQAKLLPVISSISGSLIGLLQRHPQFRPILSTQLSRFLKLRNRFVEHPLIFVSYSKIQVRPREIRVHLERLAKLFEGLVVLTRPPIHLSHVVVDDER